MNTLNLRILLGEERFIKHPLTPDDPFALPAFNQNDIVPIRLMAYERSSADPSQLESCDISALTPVLSLGAVGVHPSVGYYTLTFGATRSAPIPVNADAQTVEQILNVSTGIGVRVTGKPCNFILSRITNGASTAPTLLYDGEISATLTVDVTNPGDSSTPAQWRVGVASTLPAFTGNWAVGSVVPESTVIDKTGGKFLVLLDALAEGGFFVLVVNGVSTSPISFCASVGEIQNAVNLTFSSGNGAVVFRNSGAGFFVIFKSGTGTLTIESSMTQIPFSLLGSLDLTGKGIQELLEENAFETVDLVVRLNRMWTGATISAMVKRFVPMQSNSAIPFPPIGTPVEPGLFLSAVVGHTGGGATNLDGVQTTQLMRGTYVSFVIDGDPPLPEDWQFIADPDPGVTVTDVDAGIILPLDYDIASNANIWVKRR